MNKRIIKTQQILKAVWSTLVKRSPAGGYDVTVEFPKLLKKMNGASSAQPFYLLIEYK